MKIRKLTIQGMHKVSQKSYEFNQDVTYFVGENGAGKSTILEAIQLGLLGYIPGYAKTNESIMKHASGPVMSIILELDSGISITRIWTKTGSTVSSKVAVAGYDGKPSELTAELIGEVEMPIFNFNEFRSMTANKLKEWFISFLPSSDSSLNLIDELKQEASKRAIACDDLIAGADGWIKSRSETGIELVKALNAHFKDEQTFVKGQIAKLQGTIESLVRYDDAETLDEQEIRSDIVVNETLEAKLIAYEAQKSMQDQLQAKLVTAKATLSAESAETDSRVIAAREKIKTAETEIENLQKKLSSKNPDADAKIAELTKQIEIMQADAADISSAIAELTKKRFSLPTSEPICPYTKDRCETATKLAAKLKKEADELDKQITFKEEELEDCSPDKIAELQSQIGAIVTESRLANMEIQSKIQTYQNEIQLAKSEINQISHMYDNVKALESQLVDIGEKPTELDQLQLTSKLTTLREQLSKIQANKQYAELTSTVTADKFKLENELEILKDWTKLTDANGLQSAMMNGPFENLENDMSTYLTAMFNASTTAKFNLVSKANSFSFGLERDGQYIEFDYLSSGERCLFTLALIMCILDKSNSKVRTIIIDDILDHLDAANASYLFESLKQMKDIQFILAGVKECEDTTICKPV